MPVVVVGGPTEIDGAPFGVEHHGARLARFGALGGAGLLERRHHLLLPGHAAWQVKSSTSEELSALAGIAAAD
ncbi:MAG: hypothetical protein HS104_35090 [Polyangiaceae bacterium]|nr:hypothetical protein [Polyangiaceae bacterium]MCL4752399.1 hypothetical protein [Myxococcales bacterium]